MSVTPRLHRIFLWIFIFGTAGISSGCGGADATSPDSGGEGNEDVVSSVAVSPSLASIEVAEEIQFSATALNSKGDTLSVTTTWTVSPASMASVSSSGLVVGLETGTATVTAHVEAETGEAQLTILPETTTPTVDGETVAAVEAVVEEAMPPINTPLEDRNLLEEVEAVAAGLATLPEVDTVMVLDRALAAQTLFKDGTMHLFINNRPEEVNALPTGVAPAPNTATIRRTFPAAGAVAGPLRSAPQEVDGPPGSSRAVVTSFGGGASLADEVADMLAEAGYTILPLGPSLDDMRQYKNLGVLHLDTHGVAFIRMRRLEDGTIEEEKSFGLQTSTIVGSDLHPFREELLDGSLVISTARNAAGDVKTKIAITEDFIAANWTFDQGVVMLHACHGGAQAFATKEGGGPVVDPSILRLTMLGAGARLVVAFDNLTWPTFARPSILHFFDRMLGANDYDPEDPPLRPFPVGEVKADMQERGLLQFTRPDVIYLGVIPWGGNEVNVIFDAVPGKTSLAPSIRNFDVVDDVDQGTGQLTLDGLFGPDEGTVEVESMPLSVESWTNTEIVARAPFQAGGSAGQLIVKRPDGVASNEVPLTEWSGTMTLTTKAPGTLEAEATLDLRFRADVHAFRNGIEKDPEFRKVDTYLSPASTGTSKGSGSYTHNESTETWFGTYDLEVFSKKYVDTGAYPLTESVMGGKITLDPEEETAEICLGVWGEIDVRIQTSQGTTESTAPAGFIVPELVDRMSGLLGCFKTDLDNDTFRIDGGHRSASHDEVEFEAKWSDLVPFSAPNDETSG